MEDTPTQPLIPKLKNEIEDSSDLLRALSSNIFSSVESFPFFGLEGTTEIKKQKIEDRLLFYYHTRLQNETLFTGGDKEGLQNIERDYFCVLQAEPVGFFYRNLVEKILRLREELKRFEDNLLQTSSSATSERYIKRAIVGSKRELMNAEKLYVIWRWRHFQPKTSTGLGQLYSKPSEEDLLRKLLNSKEELMKLEGEYIRLLEDGKTYSSNQTSLPYSEDLLQRAVSSRREFLVLEEEYSILNNSRNPTKSISSTSDADTVESLKQILKKMLDSKSEMALWDEELYPTMKYEYDVDYKLPSLLERIVRLRKEYLILEEKYLYILQQRYANESSTFDVNHRHLHQVLEHVFKIMIFWRHDLRRAENAIFLAIERTPRGEKFSTYYDLSNTAQLRRELNEGDEEYFHQCERYFKMQKNISSSMDVDQLYLKHLEGDLLNDIRRSRIKLDWLEEEYYGSPFYDELLNLSNNAERLRRIEHARDTMRSVYMDYLNLLHSLHRSYIRGQSLLNGILRKLGHVPESSLEHSLLDPLPQRQPRPPPPAISEESSKIHHPESEDPSQVVINIPLHETMATLEQTDPEVKPNLVIPPVERMGGTNPLEEIIIHSDERVETDPSQEVSRPLHESTVPFDETMGGTNPLKDVRVEAPKQIVPPDERMEKTVPPDERMEKTVPPDERMKTWRAKRWGFRRSIVLGGLLESITSLVIVTSAAAANISNENIVVLALTNLIPGLFIIRHDLGGFKKNTSSGTDQGVLGWGDIMHYLLHFTVAILSLLFFGLVPPLVYALSFRNSGNKDLKIIVAAGASLSCTAFLALQKACLQKPVSENWLVHVKAAANYVFIGVGAFGLSYFAGDLFGKLADKLHEF